MGYNTQYQLQIEGLTPAMKPCSACHGTGEVEHGENVQRAEVIAAIVAFDGYNPLDESCKWYEHEDQMREVSLKFPALTLSLSGQGEEQGDVWVKEFKNGKMRSAKIEARLPEMGEWS